MIRNKTLHKIIVLLLCLTAIRGVIYGLLIPINQTPDELFHINKIKAKHLALTGQSENSRKQASVTAEIRLAEYYSIYPESRRTFSPENVQGKTLPDPPPSDELYYFVSALLLKMFSLEHVRDEIYLLRECSIVLGALVVWLSFLVARELFPGNRFVVVGVPALITFIPQFSAANASINSDKLAEVFVALSFLVMLKMLKHRITLLYFIIWIVAIELALLSKRSANFVIPLVLVFFFVYWWKHSLGIRMHAILIAGFAVFGLGVYSIVIRSPELDVFLSSRFIWAPFWNMKNILFRPELYTVEAVKQYAKFFIVLYWSFWGIFGYMSIHVHHVWYMLIAFVQFLSMCGLLWCISGTKKQHISLERWQKKALYLLTVSIFFSVFIVFFRSNIAMFDPILAQGRYLFPVMIPICVLTVFGLSALFSPKYYRIAGGVGLFGLVLFDSVCLAEYLLLNFHKMTLL
ncbi:MAG: glycosyltransferase family 39 protein [bacterium]|nr:glycosyltransferase family 39 protein [bacterium]